MGAAQKQWARRARVKLTAELGGVCVYCGAVDELTFDCKTPQGDKHHRYDTSQRMSFYRRQHRENNLQLACHPCNSAKRDGLFPF